MKKLQVRLDLDLTRELAERLEIATKLDSTITESVLVRCLLRQALAGKSGKPISADMLGYREGWLRGYGEAQHAAQEAFHAAASARRTPR